MDQGTSDEQPLEEWQSIEGECGTAEVQPVEELQMEYEENVEISEDQCLREMVPGSSHIPTSSTCSSNDVGIITFCLSD